MSVNTFDKNFLDKIISMYARGMTVREIQSHIEEIYGHHNKALLKDKKRLLFLIHLNVVCFLL